jgi:DNA processing protein
MAWISTPAWLSVTGGGAKTRNRLSTAGDRFFILGANDPMSDLRYWLGFNRVKGVGPARLQALLDHAGSIERAWAAPEPQLYAAGLDKRAVASMLEARRKMDLDAYVAEVEACDCEVMTWDSPDYPSLLRQIAAPPPVLYVRGRFEPVDQWAMAVVGTRRLSAYGRIITQQLVTSLVMNGVTVVSGLARGIDAIAHRVAVEQGGRTLAVLGSGVDHIYPPEHQPLAEQIIAGQGAIISEYPLGTPPDSKNFPGRNRLISGLALGVLVVEAGERSGALITARFALDQDREVFAIPGNINSPVSRGTNRLIQQGAKLVADVEDILTELNLRQIVEQVVAQTILPETAEEAALVAQLSGQPVHIDELIRATGLPSGVVSSTLTMMELKGMVQQTGGMNYVTLRESDAEYRLATPGQEEE